MANDVDLVLACLIHKIRRLIHVVPDPGHTIVEVSTVQLTPPRARVIEGVVNKRAIARPNFWDEQFPALSFLKKVLSEALFEDVIALILWLKFRSDRRNNSRVFGNRLMLHARVDDGD